MLQFRVPKKGMNADRSEQSFDATAIHKLPRLEEGSPNRELGS